MIARLDDLPSMHCLLAFQAVSHHLSFTRASESLGLTQTAVSHQIARLERWVGTPLFVRSRHQISLTPAGLALLPAVESGLQTLMQGVSSARGHHRAHLRISTTQEFGSQWLAPRLDSFMAEHPQITVSITLEYRRADLSAGDADVAIWLGYGGDRFTAQKLMLDEEFVVCAPALIASLPPRRALLAAPLLRHQGAIHTLLDWKRWHSQLTGTADRPQGLLGDELDFDSGPVFGDFGAMLDACRRGEGFALVRTSLVEDDLASGRLVKCFVEHLPSDLHYQLITHPDSAGRPEIAAFRSWITSQIDP